MENTTPADPALVPDSAVLMPEVTKVAPAVTEEELPPDSSLIGDYSATPEIDEKTTPAVQKKSKVLSDLVVAPIQEFEGNVAFERPWDRELTEDELKDPSLMPIQLPSLSRAHTAFAEKNMPAIEFGDDVESREWLRVIVEGAKRSAFNGMYQDTMKSSEQPFSNKVSFRERQLNPRQVTWDPLTNEQLSGKRAVLRTMTALGLHGLTQVPLWHSGLWVTFRAASDLDFVRLNQILTEENVKLGRNSYGLAYSALTGVVTAKLIEFMFEFVFETTVDIDLTQHSPSSADHPLRDIIHPEDIPAMILGFMESRFPKGYAYERGCLDNPAKNMCVIKRNFSLTELLQVRTATLNDAQWMHMTDRRSRSRSLEKVKDYQDSLVSISARRYPIATLSGYEVFVTVQSVSIKKMIESTDNWIGTLVGKVNELVGADTDMEKRNKIIMQMGRASIARQYAHFISEIEIGKARMTEREAIDQQISEWSAYDNIRDKIMEAVVDYLEKNVISIAAVPVLKCGTCKKDTSAAANNKAFTNAVPLDTIELFFGLYYRILSKLKDR